MVGVHGDHHKVDTTAVKGDFDVERDFELERMRSEECPGFAEGVIAFIDHAVDLLAQHARCAEDLETEFIGIPVELDSGGRHLALGAVGPEDGSRIATLENRDHRVEPVLRQRGTAVFLAGMIGSRG